MPSDTFFKLPEEKKQRFIDFALEEFAHNNYEAASITAMVKKMHIAKGSVYSYFNNKLDLYLYLIVLAEQKFNEMLENHGKLKEKNLLKWYWNYLLVLTNFHYEHPLLSAVWINSKHEKFGNDLENVYQKSFEKDLLFFKNQISEKTNIKENIKSHLAFSMLVSSRHFPDYIDALLSANAKYIRKNQGQLPQFKTADLKKLCKQYASSIIQ